MFFGKKPLWVMKLPCRCRKHFGGLLNIGFAEVEKAVLTTCLRPPSTLPSASARLSNACPAFLTAGSLNGVSWLTHLS
jgi:hypothetical protein